MLFQQHLAGTSSASGLAAAETSGVVIERDAYWNRLLTGGLTYRSVARHLGPPLASRHPPGTTRRWARARRSVRGKATRESACYGQQN
jgi:hypothetical protein